MKKIIIFLSLIFLFSGCSRFTKEKPAIKIDGIEITAKEFNEAFKSSSFAKENKLSSRKEFLDNFISRKLILKEAEKEGLDKDPEFLKSIQLFWEQSLIKLILSKKINELSANIRVSDKEVKDYFSKNKEKLYPDKELNEVYQEVKWLLFKKKQQAAIQDWINSLKKNARIKINYKLLGIKEK